MRYISTRGSAPALGFDEVLLTGLAADGGLYVPERWPALSAGDLTEMRGLSYGALAGRILAPFVGEAIAEKDLAELVESAYAGFDHPEIAPLTEIGENEWLLELFHGPTLAFKDYAMQPLGRLFDYVLEARGSRLTIVGATSGDTGSAAIAALAGRNSIEVFILHPHGRVSEVQRRQMTTVDAANIHNIAIEGTFDDCQDLLKALFADAAFRKETRLSAVNSINWARIAGQIVYYVWASLRLGVQETGIAFSVPTGNFGNVYAGYAARQMGLPIRQLVVGSNRNDILTRFLETGIMETREVEPSLSPSMDIQVSSNFERLLFDLLDRQGAPVAELMAEFKLSGRFALDTHAPSPSLRGRSYRAFECPSGRCLERLREAFRWLPAHCLPPLRRSPCPEAGCEVCRESQSRRRPGESLYRCSYGRLPLPDGTHIRAGQQDHESSSTARHFLDKDRTIVCRDGAMHDGQAETAPALTSGEERSEDAPGILWRNARSGILNTQAHRLGHVGSKSRVLAGVVLDGDPHRTLRAAELNRIEDQIRDEAV